MINLYIYSTVKSPRNTDGIGIYILETQTAKGPATLTKLVKMEDVNVCKAAISLLFEAISHITIKQPIRIYTKSGYIEGLYTDKRLYKWHDSEWKTIDGKEVAHADMLKALYDTHIEAEVSVESHTYSEWMQTTAQKELEKWRKEKCLKDSENSAQPKK